jgi:hypothetical protein
VFSSNNDIPGEESIKKECQQESTIEKEKSFDLAEKNAELKNLNEVSIETEVKEEQKEDRQCGGSYTEGISKVDFIEFVPDLRLWVA